MKVKELIRELREFDGELEVEADEELKSLFNMYIMAIYEEENKVIINVRSEG